MIYTLIILYNTEKTCAINYICEYWVYNIYIVLVMI